MREEIVVLDQVHAREIAFIAYYYCHCLGELLHGGGDEVVETAACCQQIAAIAER